MTLPNPDANEIGRYDETIPIPLAASGGFSSVLNRALESISAAFTKYVRTKTVFTRASGALSSSTAFSAIALSTNVIGDGFTHTAGEFVCEAAGVYRIRLNVSFEANATGLRGVRLVGSDSLDTTVIGTRQATLNALGTLDFFMSVEWIVTLGLSERIEAQALQSSGGDLQVVGEILFERIL